MLASNLDALLTIPIPLWLSHENLSPFLQIIGSNQYLGIAYLPGLVLGVYQLSEAEWRQSIELLFIFTKRSTLMTSTSDAGLIFIGAGSLAGASGKLSMAVGRVNYFLRSSA